MHLCFVPLTRDNRLCAKEVMGGRDKLVQWQDKFHDYMAQEFPQLERDQAAAVTKRKHIPTWLYKQSHRLNEEMVQIQRELKNTGALNAGKQREKILALLAKWYPEVNAFEAKLKPYDERIKMLEQRTRELRGDAERAQWRTEQEHQEKLSLIYELREYQNFIDSIPEDVLEELRQKYEMGQIQKYTQELD